MIQLRTRWLQFRVRSLLIMVAILAIPCSWLAVNLWRAERQTRAVDAIVASGGSVVYDYEDESRTGPDAPQWLVSLFGKDTFASVVTASVAPDADVEGLKGLRELDAHSSWADRDLYRLGKIRTLVALRMPFCAITDDGLKILSSQEQLEELVLSDTQISDVGLKHLRRFTRLKSLDLGCTATTDAGLQNLGELTQIQVLKLGGTQITDEGLAHLKNLQRLKRLHLDFTSIGDAGLAHVAGLKALENLRLGHTKITDAGLAQLRGLSQLEVLDLHSTGITGKGVVYLKGLPRLHTVKYDGTKVTEEDVRNLHLPRAPDDY